MKKIVTVLFILFALLQSSEIIAQDLLNVNDLSSIKVDNLSESDLMKIKTQLQSKNMTLDQAEPIALAKGMPAAEFAKLRARIDRPTLKETTSNIKQTNIGGDREQEKITNAKVKDTENSQIFGSELFDNPTLNFEPDLN